MSYFMIYSRDDAASPWAPQFGDHCRRTVRDELQDSYLRQRGYAYEGDGKHAASDLRIVQFPRVPTQRQTMAKALELGA